MYSRERYSNNKTATHVVLSPYLSVYSCFYRVTSRVYSCIYWVTPRVYSCARLQQHDNAHSRQAYRFLPCGVYGSIRDEEMKILITILIYIIIISSNEAHNGTVWKAILGKSRTGRTAHNYGHSRARIFQVPIPRAGLKGIDSSLDGVARATQKDGAESEERGGKRMKRFGTKRPDSSCSVRERAGRDGAIYLPSLFRAPATRFCQY